MPRTASSERPTIDIEELLLTEIRARAPRYIRSGMRWTCTASDSFQSLYLTTLRASPSLKDWIEEKFPGSDEDIGPTCEVNGECRVNAWFLLSSDARDTAYIEDLLAEEGQMSAREWYQLANWTYDQLARLLVTFLLSDPKLEDRSPEGLIISPAGIHPVEATVLTDPTWLQVQLESARMQAEEKARAITAMAEAYYSYPATIDVGLVRITQEPPFQSYFALGHSIFARNETIAPKYIIGTTSVRRYQGTEPPAPIRVILATVYNKKEKYFKVEQVHVVTGHPLRDALALKRLTQDQRIAVLPTTLLRSAEDVIGALNAISFALLFLINQLLPSTHIGDLVFEVPSPLTYAGIINEARERGLEK